MNTPSKKGIFRFDALVSVACGLLIAMLCGCVAPVRPVRSSNVQPWIQDGQNMGTITKVARPGGGFIYQYRDQQGVMVKLENRDLAGQLTAGACTTVFEHDTYGGQIVRCFNSSNQPCLNQFGFASSRQTNSTDQDLNRVSETDYYDCAGQPVLVQNGWSVERYTRHSDGRLVKAQFLDASRKPVGGFYLGVSGVAEAQYSYLEGVGVVTVVALLDPAGAVIARRQLSGLTDVSTTYTTSSGGYYYGGYYGGYSGHGGGSHFTPAQAPRPLPPPR